MCAVASEGSAFRSWLAARNQARWLSDRTRRDSIHWSPATANDFTNRFPIIVAAVTALPARSFLIDGEAIVTNGDGLAVFDLIRHKRHGGAAVLCAFNLIELDGEDLRRSTIEVLQAQADQAAAPT